jgi:thymidylate synthase
MHTIKSSTVRKAFEELVKLVLSKGEEIITEDNQRCKELMNVAVEITNPQIPYLHPKYPLAKIAVDRYINGMLHGKEYKHTHSDFGYTYYDRIHKYSCFAPENGDYMDREIKVNQKQHVINKLNNSPNTRRAVITLWNPLKDQYAKYTPCLQHIGFQKRKDRLYMTAVFRSNDAYLAFHSNALGLIALGNDIAKQTNCKLVNYTHLAYNMHIYIDRDKSDLIHYGFME